MCVAEQPCTAPARNVTLVFTRQGHVLRRTKTDAEGRYRVSLPAGLYRVGLGATGKIGRGIEPAQARVRARRDTKRDFSIDTGIR